MNPQVFSVPEIEAPPAGVLTINDQEFEAFRQLILREAGISLSDAKRVLVCSRLGRRLRHFGFQTFTQYYDYLVNQDSAGEERRNMINCITTNKTEFFREPHHFDFLRDHVVPRLRERAAQGGARRIRIWSAGCSSGEEPYSIAITLREALSGLAGWDLKILASDIDTDMLQTAERGIYGADRIDGLNEQNLRRHFLRGHAEWRGYYQVRPDVRALIVFRRINLIEKPWPIRTQFDVIFCRNVIIYFNRETQQSLFESMAQILTPEGYLLVGHSESLHWLNGLFQPLRGTIYKLRLGEG